MPQPSSRMQLTGYSSNLGELHSFLRGLPCLLTMLYTQLTIANLQTNHLVRMDRESFEHLQGCRGRAIPAIPESSNFLQRLTMPSYNAIYSVEDCQLANKPLGVNGQRILQAPSRIQLTGNSSNLCELQPFLETHHVFLRRNVFSWRLPTFEQTICCYWMKDPSSIFKDTVDGLFQQALTALDDLNDFLGG